MTRKEFDERLREIVDTYACNETYLLPDVYKAIHALNREAIGEDKKLYMEGLEVIG